MPKTKKTNPDDIQPISMRLDKDTETYYRRRANERGVSLSVFLRETLVQGVIAENVQDIEQRLRHLIEEIGITRQKVVKVEIPDELWISVFTAEYLLAAIVEARDVQQLYDAQNKAKAKLNRIKGG